MSAALPINEQPRDPRGEARTTGEGSSDLTNTRQAAETGEAPRPSPVARLLLGLIAIYRWTAVVRSPRCRFAPTCSSYAAESVRTHGAARGGWLALRRISRCHPWNPGGVDHVPPRN